LQPPENYFEAKRFCIGGIIAPPQKYPTTKAEIWGIKPGEISHQGIPEILNRGSSIGEVYQLSNYRNMWLGA
jgi:hypothetical protein